MNAIPALAALLAAVAGLAAGRLALTRPLEIGINASGRLAYRPLAEGDEGTEHGLRCVFAAPWLITARHGTIWVRIWPDSVPGNVFRRLWVHIRWNPGRQPADLTATAPVRHG